MEFTISFTESFLFFVFYFVFAPHSHAQSSKSNNSNATAITIVKSNDQKRFVIYVEINEQIMNIWGRNCVKSIPQSQFRNFVAYGTFHHLNMCVNTENSINANKTTNINSEERECVCVFYRIFIWFGKQSEGER